MAGNRTLELAVEELRGEQRQELERQRLRLRGPRLVGVLLLLLGIALATVGNLL